MAKQVGKRSTIGTVYESDNISDIMRDPRSSFSRFLDTLVGETAAVFIMLCSVMFILFAIMTASESLRLILLETPILIMFFLFVNSFLFWVALANLLSNMNIWFPEKVPLFARSHDKEIDPAKDGTFFWGHVLSTERKHRNAVVAYAKEDVCTHVFIFGTTGSGKTESMLSISLNALLSGSGFIYVDAKADPSLEGKVVTLVRRFMREDDLYVLNYSRGAKDISTTRKPEYRSNTLNFIADAPSTTVAELLISLMSGDDGGDNAVWTGQAKVLLKSGSKAMVGLRDMGEMAPSISDFSSKLSQVSELINIVNNEKLDIGKRQGLREYLLKIGMTDDEIEEFAKYKASKDSAAAAGAAGGSPQSRSISGMRHKQQAAPPKMKPDVVKYHSFSMMNLNEALSLLAHDYRYIFDRRYADIDLYDVIVRRRILLVLIPPLENAATSTQALGKIIVAMIKSVLAASMGAGVVDGSKKQIIDKRSSADKAPFLCLMDEKGYYCIDGESVIPGQARSLGLAMVYGSQDFGMIKKALGDEANNMLQNTNIKACMKQQDPEVTADLLIKQVGKVYVNKTGGYSANQTMSGYRDTGNIQVEQTDRVNFLDLAQQEAGQALVVFGGEAHWTQMMYAMGNLKAYSELRTNHFVPLPKITEKMAEENLARKRILLGTWGNLGDREKYNIETDESMSEALEEFKRGCKESNSRDSMFFEKGIIFSLYKKEAKTSNVQENIMSALDSLIDDDEDDDDDVTYSSKDDVFNDNDEGSDGDESDVYDDFHFMAGMDRQELESNISNIANIAAKDDIIYDPDKVESKTLTIIKDSVKYPTEPHPKKNAAEITGILGLLADAMDEDNGDNSD